MQSLQAQENLVHGFVERVSDGDTLRIRTAEGTVVVRLAGIDAPEKRQPFGRAASRDLAEICLGKQADADARKKDRYGRTVARLRCEGADPSSALLSEGLAWHYVKYAREQPQTEREADASAEIAAREKRLGLWAGAEAIPPWEFRKSAKRN